MRPGVLNCLGTVKDLLIPFVFFIFHDFLCVDILDRSCLHFFSIWFLAVFFGVQYLAFGFWHLLLAYSVKHFVSISSVIFWHLYSTHTFHQRLGSFPSLPEAVRVMTLRIQPDTVEVSDCMHVHLNILELVISIAFLLNAKITFNLLI